MVETNGLKSGGWEGEEGGEERGGEGGAGRRDYGYVIIAMHENYVRKPEQS